MPASRERIRQSLNRVRTVHNIPPRKTIKRRVYKVKGPLSMLHIDGHHKLIRYNTYTNVCLCQLQSHNILFYSKLYCRLFLDGASQFTVASTDTPEFSFSSSYHGTTKRQPYLFTLNKVFPSGVFLLLSGSCQSKCRPNVSIYLLPLWTSS